MNIKQRYIIFLLIIGSFLLISGCESKKDREYKNLAKEFYTIYFNIIRVVEINKATESLNKLQAKEVYGKLDKMEELLKNIRAIIPNEDPVLLERYEGRVDNLRFICKVGSELEKLNFEERYRIGSVLLSMSMDKSSEDDLSLLMY